ncbi:hypothetical protein DFQ30_006826 [Apophysomyces sp. BC1015]|nr:hypothetical protein DFQ30_006826 [Apophysomyces sp. BC1015]
MPHPTQSYRVLSKASGTHALRPLTVTSATRNPVTKRREPTFVSGAARINVKARRLEKAQLGSSSFGGNLNRSHEQFTIPQRLSLEPSLPAPRHDQISGHNNSSPQATLFRAMPDHEQVQDTAAGNKYGRSEDRVRRPSTCSVSTIDSRPCASVVESKTISQLYAKYLQLQFLSMKAKKMTDKRPGTTQDQLWLDRKEIEKKEQENKASHAYQNQPCQSNIASESDKRLQELSDAVTDLEEALKRNNPSGSLQIPHHTISTLLHGMIAESEEDVEEASKLKEKQMLLYCKQLMEKISEAEIEQRNMLIILADDGKM